MENHMTVTFDAISENEAFARMVVSAFMVGANPTVGEMDDVKTAVSEAVTNAVIHGYDKKTGNVMMRCSMKENLLTICVQDFGKGIDPRYHQSIFDRYFRVPGTKVQGSGLGLSISKDFIEAHGGTLTVQSELGIGSRFAIRLKA